MALISQLKVSILDMPLAEAQRLILDLRHKRRTYVPPKKRQKVSTIFSSAKQKKAPKQQPLQVDQMDANSLESLIELLEGVMKK